MADGTYAAKDAIPGFGERKPLTERDDATSAPARKNVERCLNCNYYDRNATDGAGGKSPRAGQCRREAPKLSPINPKNYMIEGVWPTVRDEDWCGEFKLAIRRSETQRADALLGAIGTATPASAASRVSALTNVPSVQASIGTLRGNGDD